MNSQRALLRWVLRVVRAEWRQHVLVVALVGFGIAIATVLVISAVRFEEPTERLNEAPASVELWVSSDDPEDNAALRGEMLAAGSKYVDTEIQMSGPRSIQGPVLLGADPTAPLGSVNFQLIEGRWPAAGEVALTARAIDQLNVFFDEPVRIGQTREIGAANRTIVGVWENPNNLRRSAALVALDQVESWTSARVLLPSTSHDAITAYTSIGTMTDNGEDPLVKIATQITGSESTGPNTSGSEPTTGVMLSYLAGTVLCMQIAVLASAGFTVLASRRTRQLAMLSAMGAKPRQLGLVVRFTGIIVGLVGGFAGAAAGIAISIASTPLLQRQLNHRIHAFDVPWLAVLAMLPLAVLTTTAAAWWPARRVRKASTIEALGAIRPPETGVAKSLSFGLVLAGVGSWLLIKGVPRNSGVWVTAGMVALTLGCLLLAPAAVSILGAVADRSSLPVRIAWRDINRNRTRSATATAAAAMAIAVPFSIAAFMASLSASSVPYVPPNAVVINSYDGFVDVADGPAAFGVLLDAVDDARIIPIQLPVDRELTERVMADHGIEVDSDDASASDMELLPFGIEVLRASGNEPVHPGYATPELLEAMNLAEPSSGTDLIKLIEADLKLPDRNDDIVVEQAQMHAEIYPEVLIVADMPGLSSDDVVVYNWVLTRSAPFTQAELDKIESVARQNGHIGIGLPDEPSPLTALRVAALAIAGLLGLGVVAVSVALVRVENQTADQVLNSIGASPRLSRSIGAATALGLVIPAIAIAVPSAFVALAAIYLNPDENYDFVVPWPELAVVLVLIPTLAVIGGWNSPQHICAEQRPRQNRTHHREDLSSSPPGHTGPGEKTPDGTNMAQPGGNGRS